jgi:hypothetical protein
MLSAIALRTTGHPWPEGEKGHECRLSLSVFEPKARSHTRKNQTGTPKIAEIEENAARVSSGRPLWALVPRSTCDDSNGAAPAGGGG